jgi:signal transduction histidine kinase
MRRFQLDRRAFRSRVARRIFLVFGASALLPVAAFAGFALFKVSGELEQSARQRLRTESKAVGMAVLDRLVAFEMALGAVVAAPPSELPQRTRHFRGLWLLSGSDAPPDASDPHADLLPRTASEWAHLDAGRSLLRVVSDPGGRKTPRLFLLRSGRDGAAASVIVAELQPMQVWRPDTLRADMEVRIRDPSGQILFASAAEFAKAGEVGPGDRMTVAGESYLGASWDLFLGAMYGAGTWRIEEFQADSAVLLPVHQFRSAFVSIALLAGGLVLFLSSGLIRRSLGPIDALRTATDSVARGDFDLRVEIETDDEFRDLGTAFNDMTSRISDLTRNLEAKVAARTRELQETLDELRRTQAQLVHREKMASLGQFVAGIAHELNNPLAFVEGNLHFLRQYMETLADAIEAFDRELAGADPRIRERLAKIRDEFDLEDVVDDLESVFGGCADGVQRATTLVADLRSFSRLDDGDRAELDLCESLDSTLNILSSRLGHVQLVREYEPLPPVECLAAQLNQVFLNLVANAVDATGGTGRVTVRTRDLGGEKVAVEIEDDGCGMDDATLKRIFEPFYTTKAVGSGTGLGLSISYGIVERHHGEIQVESEVGRGTCFRVILPVRWAGTNPFGTDPTQVESEEPRT